MVHVELIDGGVRAVHASGPPNAGNWAHQWPQDLERLQKKYFSSTDQLVTLRMFSGPIRDNWAVARKLGLRITTELLGPQAAALLDSRAQEKLVGPDNTFNHCGALPQKTWQILVDTGANINVCPRSDAQYALGEGICALQRAWDHGIKPRFSILLGSAMRPKPNAANVKNAATPSAVSDARYRKPGIMFTALGRSDERLARSFRRRHPRLSYSLRQPPNSPTAKEAAAPGRVLVAEGVAQRDRRSR